MTTKEYCMSRESIAYWSGLDGLEIKGIKYGIEDYVYFVTGAWTGKAVPHRSKIYYGEKPFFRVNGYKVPLDECIRIERKENA